MLRKLARNTAVALAGTTAQKMLAFVTTLVLARGLGQEGFGTYSFVGVYIFFFSFLVDLGMERVVTRGLAEAPERLGRLLGNALMLRLALAAVAVIAAYVVALLLDVSGEVRYCILLAALGLPLSVDILFRSYFQSQYQVHYIYFITLPSTVSFLGLAALCVHWSLPVHAIFYAGLLNAGVTLGLLLVITLPRIRLSLRPEPALMRELLRDAGEVGLFVLLFMLAMRIDQILLFKLRGAGEVGRYAVGVRVTEALSILPEALMMTVFPVLASTRVSAPERFEQTYRLAFKYLSAVILPVALLLTILRREFVTGVFGVAYGDSTAPLVILAWGMFFAYAGSVYLNLLIIGHRQRLLLLVSGVAVAVNIAVNLWLIPVYGATGAAWATFIANAVGFACWALHPHTSRFIATCAAETARPLICVLVAWLIIASLSLQGLAAGVLVVGMYPLGMLMLGGFTRSDIRLVRRLFAAEPAT